MDFELKYDGDNMFLEKAKDIADKLLPAWNTPSGIPYNTINLAHGNAHNPGWTGGDSIPVDSGTEQLEFIALSQRAGDLKYQQKVENVILELNKTFPADGLLPNYINPHRGTPSHSTITFGAMGDSFLDQNVQIRPFMTARVNEYASYLTKHYNALLPYQSVSCSTSLIKSFLFFHLSILRNAGRGSNFTEDGDVECDASLMDGKSRSFRAVGAVPSNYYQV